MDRAAALDDLRAKLTRQRAPKADTQVLAETAAHLDTIWNNLRDVASRMEG
jgi:uncharacterized membrane protein